MDDVGPEMSVGPREAGADACVRGEASAVIPSDKEEWVSTVSRGVLRAPKLAALDRTMPAVVVSSE